MTLPPTAAAGLSFPSPSTSAATRSEDAAVAGKAFEELLLHELLKTMRQTIPSEDGDFGQETIDSMFDQAIAEQTAGTLGLSKVFERQLGGSPQAPPTALTPPPWRPPAPGLKVAPTARPEFVPSHAPAGKHAIGVIGMQMPVGALPVDGVQSSEYGPRIHPISGEHKFHGGMDIAAAEGTEIRAVQQGIVTHAGWKPGYGNVVEILHSDGVTTRYAHASRVHVREGQRVDAGEGIADVGQTGQATGPHLHFEARRNGHTMDPERYLDRLRGRSADPSASGEPPQS